ncbi:MAG TPA: hypothetical protein VL049_01160 [Candidatus Dormibacteraeota bacterium]|nr:hypothetical protein [Candidatus Dormibacteraeota bacterium]
MRRATAIGLGLATLIALVACGGGGEDGQAPPAVLDEVQASEAIAAAALRVAGALTELADDRMAVDQLGRASFGGGCLHGTLTGSCGMGHRVNTLRVSARHCQLLDAVSGLRLTVEGRLTVTTPFAICGLGGLIPLEAVRTYRFDHFSATVEDGAGVVEAFAAERLVETLLPLRTGCDQGDATIDLDGTMSAQRRGGLDAALRATDLHLERRGSGSAGACTRTIEARGGVAVDDRSAGRTAGADLDGLTVEVDAAGGLRRIDGGFALGCARPLTIATDQPLVAGDGCPSAGMLELERRDGSRGFVDLAAGGLRVDADGDGTPDRVTADCRDLDIATCP